MAVGEEPDFDLVVESEPCTLHFEIPRGWTTDTVIARGVTAEIHIQPDNPTTARAPAILTFHDVGQNGAIAFAPFFANFRRSHPHIDSAMAHYHLNAPGHLPNAPDCDTQTSFDLVDIVNSVLELIERLQIKSVVAFGIGLGGAILTQAAALNPKAFLGLVLISPVLQPAAQWERLGSSVEGFFAKNLGYGLGRRVKDRLMARWLSDDSRESNHAVCQSLEDGLDRLNACNVLKFLEVDMWRTGVEHHVKDVKAKVLLITGKESSLREQTADVFSTFNPSTTSWLELPGCGSLTHDERPEKVVESVSLFLQGIPGYC